VFSAAVHATIVAVTAATADIFIPVRPEIIFFCNLHRRTKMSSGLHVPSVTKHCDNISFY